MNPAIFRDEPMAVQPQREASRPLAEGSAHVAAERERLATNGTGDAFDVEVARTVREQATRKGIHYGE